MLVVSDNELNVRDDEVASSEVAEGGTYTGRTGQVMWIGPGATPVNGNGIIHVEARNRTSEELEMPGYCWIQQISGTPVD